MPEPLKADDNISPTMKAGHWQGLIAIASASVSPLNVQDTSIIMGEFQMALARAERAAIDAKEAASKEAATAGPDRPPDAD